MKKLNDLLADLVVLNQKVYTLHWNAKGLEGFEAHELTDKLYNGLTEFIDEVGEKIKMTGEMPLGTLKEMLAITSIQEIAARNFTADEIIKIVIADLTSLEKTVLDIKPDHRIQPLFDEIFMFIDKSRYLFSILIK